MRDGLASGKHNFLALQAAKCRGRRRISQIKDGECDNVLPDQGYRTAQGAGIDG
jgi:hypothetical protein